MNSRVTLADRLAALALVGTVIASGVGLVVAGLYRDGAEMVRQARAADLVTLFVVAPLLGLGLWRAWSGSSIGRLVAMGALGYLAYSYAIYAFSVVINPMTPVHIAILGLATWSVGLSASALDGATVARASRIRLPRRTSGGFLILVAALFAMLWLSQIAGAISSGTLPPSIGDLGLPTTPIYALDLAFALPVLALAGAWLIRRDPRASALGLAALAFVVPMGLSVLAIFVVDAGAGIPVEVVPLVIFATVTIAAGALVAVGLTSTWTQGAIAARAGGRA